MIVATIDDKVIKFRKYFRYDKRWIGEEGLMDSITRGWNSSRAREKKGIVDRTKWSWRFRGSYKKRIEMRNNIGNKKVELSGIPVGTEIQNFIML